MGIFDLPNTHGWRVCWFTGETKTLKNGNVKKLTAEYRTTIKEEAERVRAEKEAQGLKASIMECFFKW